MMYRIGYMIHRMHLYYDERPHDLKLVLYGNQ
jgi:hypothetical protein